KEPVPAEYHLLREGQVLFMFFSLSAAEERTLALMKSGAIAIAYERVRLADGSMPLLKPMSEIAGRAVAQLAAVYLGKTYQGSGRLLGGVTGVPPASVVVLGAGTVGTGAARVAAGIGAQVVVIDKDADRLRCLAEEIPGQLETLVSDPDNIARAVREADVVIGAAAVAGQRAPVLVTRQMLKTMKPGSVVIDAAIDQGGCIEASRPTTHEEPVYITGNIIRYCVPNVPGMYPRTATVALANATLPYALKLANLGYHRALREDGALRQGLSVFRGKLTDEQVAASLGLEYTPGVDLLSGESLAGEPGEQRRADEGYPGYEVEDQGNA
ncbi:alanine dehydrogenase, partial [Chloroflexota bacterium]